MKITTAYALVDGQELLSWPDKHKRDQYDIFETAEHAASAAEEWHKAGVFARVIRVSIAPKGQPKCPPTKTPTRGRI